MLLADFKSVSSVAWSNTLKSARRAPLPKLGHRQRIGASLVKNMPFLFLVKPLPSHMLHTEYPNHVIR